MGGGAPILSAARVPHCECKATAGRAVYAHSLGCDCGNRFLPGYGISLRLDPRGDGFPQLLHGGRLHAQGTTTAELLRLDLVPAANQLCGHRTATWWISAPHSPHSAADGSARGFFLSDREANLADLQSWISCRDDLAPGPSDRAPGRGSCVADFSGIWGAVQ